MKLIKCKNELVQEKKFPGLINVKFTHEIKSTTCNFDYLGPKIPPEMWQTMLSFFKWTYDTTHSESQVRLYVNPDKKIWAVWAYPQEAQTGMSAREIDNEDMKLQRAQFGENEGWVYFGTVHHHCGCSAFQSAVDERNEETIDGLHITVGSMSSSHYDLHCRFYLNGACFDPDMSVMWDVGDEMRKLAPAKLWNEIARHQMGVPSDAKFPEIWRTNLIEIKPAWKNSGQGALGFRGNDDDYYGGVGSSGAVGYGLPANQRAWLCAKEIMEDVAESPWTLEQLTQRIEFLKDDAIIDIITLNLTYYRIDLIDLINAWPEKKPAKKIFNKAMKRLNREFNGPIDDKEDNDDPATDTGGQPGGETGGSPPVDPNMYESM